MKFILPAACSVLLLAACGSDPVQQFTRAQGYFASHDYIKAKLDLADLLDKEPGNAKARILLARTYLALGDGEAATTALKALPAAQRPGDYAEQLGEAALLRGQPDDALAAVAQVTTPSAQRIRALAYLAQDDLPQARIAFEGGLASGSKDARLLADYARFQLQKGEIASAREMADAAFAADPTSLDALLMRGEIATVEGQLKQALDAFSMALDSYPGNVAALIGKASVLGDLGRQKDMQALLDSASSAAIKAPAITYLQARAAAARGDWSGTRRILQANEQIVRQSDDAAMLYAQALHRLGQDEQARGQLAPVLTRTPGNAKAIRLMAAIKLKLGDAQGAFEIMAPLAGKASAPAADLALYAKAAKAAGRPDAAALAARAQLPNPKALGAALAEADAALKARNWGNAAGIYQNILDVTDGTNPIILNNLAVARSQLGDKDAAVDLALKALKFAPDNASIMDTAGWLLYQTGRDKARALTLLRQANAKAPDNQTIERHYRIVQAGGKPDDN